MDTIIIELLKPANLVLTIFLAICLLYWMMVILGALDLESLELDFDFDLDADLEQPGFHLNVLKFLNLGEVPLMILLSVFLFVSWAISLLTHQILGITSNWISIALLLPVLLVGLTVSTIVTRPLKSVFKGLNKPETHTKPEDLIGSTARVTTGTLDREFGQIEVDIKGSSLVVKGRTSDETTLKHGDSALIVHHERADDIYIVRPIETANL